MIDCIHHDITEGVTCMSCDCYHPSCDCYNPIGSTIILTMCTTIILTICTELLLSFLKYFLLSSFALEEEWDVCRISNCMPLVPSDSMLWRSI